MKPNFARNLLVNALAQIRTMRAAMLSGIDAKRPRAWCEYGYASDLSFENYFLAYDRDGLGNAAIDIIADKCWQDHPWLIEGAPDRESTELTSNEARIDRVFSQAKVWQAFKEADVMALVAGWSAIIIRIADSNELDQPTVRPSIEALTELVPVWENQLTAVHDSNHVLQHYVYAEPQTGISPARNVNVHPDRVVIVGDPSRSRPLLKAGFNALATLEKVLGGAGESFLKNASRQLNVNYDSEVDLEDIARANGGSVADLHENLSGHVRDINSGVDLLMMTQGATVNPMTVAVSDPMPSYTVALQVFAASVKIPVKVLVGNITGERASTEDIKQLNARCQSRRVSEVTAHIEKFVAKLKAIGMLSAGQYSVMWNDLRESTDGERADHVDKLASIIEKIARADQSQMMTGSDPVLTVAELRSALGYDK
ncbi:MAG: DUF1073 domain-containing protein [Desulfuromonas sp.]|nr:DUF1073 domain-containing protein [Desulfuromonas sp.]